ncbi:MAG: hypothetical protein J6M39_05770 [Lachnospiraceae bacterium]|nr:hypothetical protein [Lachnospiraceae bacterium]
MKAEFDSLRNDFQSQINQYNTSIDSKIDGAIAGYLAGISLAKKEEQYLDVNSKYLFPLKMILNREWSTNDAYYDVAMPRIKYYQAIVRYRFDPNTRPDPTTGTWQQTDGGTVTMSSNIAINADTSIFRLGKYENYFVIDGQKGVSNVIEDSGLTKSIDGSQHKIWIRKQVGKGQYSGYWRKNMEILPFTSGYNGGRTQPLYIYSFWVGLPAAALVSRNGTSGTAAAAKITWNGSSSRLNWTRTGGMGGNTNNIRAEHYSTYTINDATTLSGQIANWNSTMDSGINSINGTFAYDDAATILGEPDELVMDWEHTDGTNQVYSGTAYMPANVDGYWSLTAPYETDANKIAMALHKKLANGGNEGIAWNLYSGTREVGFDNMWNEWFIPRLVPTKNDNFQQDSSNNFSEVRASCVIYEDSNGKTHYMDEGMYLGHYGKEGKVEFVIRFNGNNGIRVNFALSKKPFGFNRSDADRIKFKFSDATTTSSTKVDVPDGGYGYINTNNSIKIEVDDIEKGDELYMIWWPQTSTDYVELDSITDYYIETTG